MAVLTWDQTGQRRFETGVDKGVLYIPDAGGVYNNGVAWNGLVTVTESPSGADANPQYADNQKYLSLRSAEEFGATVEAFTYPDEFAQFDGMAVPTPGVTLGQQGRKPFGLSYRSKVGNDVGGMDAGYKLHLVYGATASPSEKAYGTVNESPEAITFSWELATEPVPVAGYKSVALLTVDSTKVPAGALASLEQLLYGTAGVNAALPLPATVIAMISAAVTTVTPTQPAYNGTTKVVTIPTITGVTYYMDGVARANGATVTITKDTIIEARPNAGYIFPPDVDNDWFLDF